jgi:hypothetical protein
MENIELETKFISSTLINLLTFEKQYGIAKMEAPMIELAKVK